MNDTMYFETTRLWRPIAKHAIGLRTSLRMAILAAIGVVGAAGAARASGPQEPVVFVEPSSAVLRSQLEFASEPIELGLQSDRVEDLEVTSVIEDARGRTIASEHSGKSIIPAAPPNLSLHPDVVVARYGDIVRIPRRNVEWLARGVYSETVKVAVSDTDYDVPVDIVRIRFFRVSAAGVEDISSAEFSAAADGLVYAGTDKNGAAVTLIDGRGFERGDKRAAKVFLPKMRQGRIENLDTPEMESGAHGAPVAGDRSEADEE